MRKFSILGFLAGMALFSGMLYWLPPVHQRLSWRLDFAMAYLRGVVQPVSALPTARPHLPQPRVAVTRNPTRTPVQTTTPTATATPGPTATPTPSPTPLPGAVSLPAPEYEKQDINNCGPASLSMYLHLFGWKGNQFDIAKLVKPHREDRNVNIDELAYFVHSQAGWLNATYRVGGDLELLKRLLAAGFPVVIEEGFHMDAPYWPNDDLWAAHYLLLTGYDDQQQVFTGQDSYYGANRKTPYTRLDQDWQTFNRAYFLVYLPEQEPALQALLGADWDLDANRQHALETAQAETQAEPQNAFAWFNLGSNQVYFERYSEAAEAYDTARDLGLPQRMLRYQFGPFIAYFRSGRNDDLLALTEYALQRTPNAEEAHLWQGWGLYQQGKVGDALAEFQKALEERPDYPDALYAINYAQQN